MLFVKALVNTGLIIVGEMIELQSSSNCDSRNRNEYQSSSSCKLGDKIYRDHYKIHSIELVSEIIFEITRQIGLPGSINNITLFDDNGVLLIKFNFDYDLNEASYTLNGYEDDLRRSVYYKKLRYVKTEFVYYLYNKIKELSSKKELYLKK